MPKDPRVPIAFFANYDEKKDLIYLTADAERHPKLADGGLYITLKKNTSSESLLRQYLTNSGQIKSPRHEMLVMENLIERDAISATNAKLLKLLAGNWSSVLVLANDPEASKWAAATYVAQGRSPRVLTLDMSQKITGVGLSDYLADTVALVVDQPDAMVSHTADQILSQTHRMRPDFVVLNLHADEIPVEELAFNSASQGMVYRMTPSGRGYAPEVDAIRARGGKVDAVLRVDDSVPGFWEISVGLLD